MVQTGPAADNEPSFRERLPDRLALFGIGLVGGTAVGLIAGAVFDAANAPVFGYTMSGSVRSACWVAASPAAVTASTASVKASAATTTCAATATDW